MPSLFNAAPNLHKPKLPNRFVILQATRLPPQAQIIFSCGRPFRRAVCGDRRALDFFPLLV